MGLRKFPIEPEFKKFGASVKSILSARGITREDFSEQTGISTNTINKICNGKQMPSIKLAVQLSRYLDISLDDVFDIQER